MTINNLKDALEHLKGDVAGQSLNATTIYYNGEVLHLPITIKEQEEGK